MGGGGGGAIFKKIFKTLHIHSMSHIKEGCDMAHKAVHLNLTGSSEYLPTGQLGSALSVSGLIEWVNPGPYL